MGVSLPSDLVVDVMRNADPSRLKGAVAKLQSIGGTAEGVSSFASVLEGPQRQWAVGWDSLFSQPAATETSTPASSFQAGDPYVGFEQMVLRNMLEQLLPDAGSGAFGTGTSAEIWRSLAADQLAHVYSQAGGIGIGPMLAEQDTSRLAQSPEGQWPYFSTSQIRAFTG